MTPDLAVRVLDLYSRVTAAMRADDIETGSSLMLDIEAAIAADDQTAGSPEVGPLIGLCQEARQEAFVAATEAQERLRQAAYRELHTGQAGQRAYSGSDDKPDARFFDNLG